jgi:lipoprotein NlpI
MFLGDHRGALEDYSEMIAIDAAQDTPHWRRGIAYYFNQRFQEGADQFERYHAYDARDRENGLWKFLCDVQSKGLVHAQSKMLPYKQFDRHPFPQLYALYGGSLSLADYNEAVRPHVESSRMVKFFHLYYRGLHVVTSDKKAGLADIREAVSLFSASDVADTGPGYMWHCARLHIEWIERQSVK